MASSMTFVVAVGSWCLAMCLAHRAARRSASRRAASLTELVAGYVSYHRNVPTLVQLMLWYFGISSLLPDARAVLANDHSGEAIFAIIGAGLCQAAYFSEDLRSGLRAVPTGQGEAARALGPRLHRRDALRPDAPGDAQRAAGTHQPQRLAVQKQQFGDGDRRRRAHPCREGGREPQFPDFRDLPYRDDRLSGLLARSSWRRGLLQRRPRWREGAEP